MLIYFLILLGAAMRVVPHPANFAPVAAVGLFAGVYLDKKQAIALPIAAMLVSDFFIGFDSLESRLVVYGSLIVASLLGMAIREHKNIATVAGASLLGSAAFYLLTNLVWLYPAKMYPHTWVGQITSYTNALPFFRNTLLGDLFYAAVFFGVYEAVKYYHGYKSQSANQVIAGKN